VEQQRIAAILTSIDNAIEATEALIEKHQQIKAGLMHDLFTRGVDAQGTLGPTVKGLPASWKWVALGELAKVVSGVTLGGGAPAGGVTVPYLRVANVQDGYLDLSEVKTIQVTWSVAEDLRLLPGDVLMNEGGDFDKLGRGTVWAGEIEHCIHQNHVFRVRTNRAALLPEYLAFHSEADYGKRYFLLSSKQSTNLASINATQLRRYPIALPPVAEQARVVERISAANAHRVALDRSVAKLRAQKLGLMQDLLTGKVRVTAAPAAMAHA
jgi:type I restriction enzyme, S subunit